MDKARSPILSLSQVRQIGKRLIGGMLLASLSTTASLSQVPTPDRAGLLYQEVLRQTATPTGRMLSYTGGNTLPQDWIIATNPNASEKSPFKVAMKSLLESAETRIDISSLADPPSTDDAYFKAIKESIEKLNTYQRHVSVRLIFGRPPNSEFGKNLGVWLEELTSGIRNQPIRTVDVQVAAMTSSILWASWNHSKIIAVDGRRAIVGGHNLWGRDYDNDHPVFDLSMRIDGPAAASATRYNAVLWTFACKYKDSQKYGFARQYSAERNTITHTCSVDDSIPAPPAPGLTDPGLKVAGVSHSGIELMKSVPEMGDRWTGDQKYQWGDIARDRAFATATSSIRISQQSLSATYLGRMYNPHSIDALADAVMRGVDVYIVISNGDAGGYSTSRSIEELAAEIYGRIRGRPNARELACKHLNLAYIAWRLSPGSTAIRHWPPGRGGGGIGNHAKFFMVDEELIYVGSQNMYPPAWTAGSPNMYYGANQEFGFLFSDTRAGREVMEKYWNPLWKDAGELAYMGKGVTCPL